MKLIIQNNRIAATVLPEYQSTGYEQAVIDAPEGFDIAHINEYVWQNDQLVHAPREVLAAWFVAALDEMNLLATVEAAVQTLPSTKQILWTRAYSFKENDSDVIAIATALNISLKGVFDKADEIRQRPRT